MATVQGEPEPSEDGAYLKSAIGIMEQMQYFEEMGDYSGAYSLFISLHGWKVLASNDPTIITEFGLAMTKLAAAINHEAKYGRGSLLNMSHPQVERKIEAGVISSEMVQAALKSTHHLFNIENVRNEQRNLHLRTLI